MSGAALDWAARLVVRGVNVIPVGADKRPTGPWRRWQAERQIDLPSGEDDRYLERFEGGGNLAAITGRVSEIVVLDADSREAWAALVAACGGRIPPTVIVNTAKGRHVWFAHPGEVVRNSVRVGGVPLDVRGDGGYVIVPPSIHPSGVPYTWRRSPLEVWPPAPIPVALLELLAPPGVSEPRRSMVGSRRGSRYGEVALERETAAVSCAAPGARNDTLNRAAFSLARLVASGDLPPADVAHALTRAALAAGLPETEARRTIASALSARGAA